MTEPQADARPQASHSPSKKPFTWRALLVRAVVPVAGLGIAFFSLKGLALKDALAKVASFPLHTLVIVLLAALLQIAAQASRLWLVFPRHHRPSWLRVARGFSFGQLVNMTLPARAGDVVKVVSIANDKERAATVIQTTGALLADRMLDIGTMVVLALCFSGLLMKHAWPSALVLGVAGLGLVAAGLIAWLLLRRRWPAARGKLVDVGRAFVASAKALRHPKRLSRGVAIGCIAIAAEVSALMVLCSSLGIGLSVGAAVSVLVVLTLGVAIPVSVANIGAFEASIALGLSRFGVSTSSALAIGTVQHAAQLAAVAVAAVVFWQRDRFLARARRLAAQCVGAVSSGSAPNVANDPILGRSSTAKSS